jgi:RluA family pseudouridine synthase
VARALTVPLLASPASAMRAGALTLNGKRLLSFDFFVKRADAVALAALPGAGADAAAALVASTDWRARVLFEDAHLLVIDKPSGVASAPARAEPSHAIGACEAMLRARDGPGAPPELFPLHRLDKDTSGVLMMAKDARICAPVSRAFRTRGVAKTYWALLGGALPAGEESGQWSDALELGNDGKAHVLPAGAVDAEGEPRGKSAKTRFSVTERLGRFATLVSLAPLTGRMHQLRAQAAARGAAVMGDDRYGMASASAANAKGAPPRLCLHCARMEMEHPAAPGTQLRFEAPLPEALAVYAQRVRKAARAGEAAAAAAAAAAASVGAEVAAVAA